MTGPAFLLGVAFALPGATGGPGGATRRATRRAGRLVEASRPRGRQTRACDVAVVGFSADGRGGRVTVWPGDRVWSRVRAIAPSVVIAGRAVCLH